MWPKVIAQLFELLPHVSRLLPMADKFLTSKTATEKATEAAMIGGCAQALKEIQQAVAAAGGSPSKKMDPSLAITALAEAGASLSQTFNAGISSVYGDDSLRSLSSMFLLEATSALSVVLPPTVEKAMLSLIVLTENTTFNMADYLNGTLPDQSQIALSQSLVGL